MDRNEIICECFLVSRGEIEDAIRQKGLKTVVVSLILSCVLQTVTAIFVNKYITFPLYGMSAIFDSVLWLLIAFNVIKSVSVSVLTVLLYKRIGYVFEKINIR